MVAAELQYLSVPNRGGVYHKKTHAFIDAPLLFKVAVWT